MDDSRDASSVETRSSTPDNSMETLSTINMQDIEEEEEELDSSANASTSQASNPPPAEEGDTEQASANTSTESTQRRTTSSRATTPRGPARNANVQMAGAVSSLVGMMRNQESMVNRVLRDQSNANLTQQYLDHIDSLKKQLEESNKLLDKERQLFQEQIRTMGLQHRHEIDRLMQHQSSHLYYTVMSLLPLMEQVPQHRLISCQFSLLEAVKNHLEYTPAPLNRATTTWSPSQAYKGYNPGPTFPPSTHPNPAFPPSTHPNPVFPPSTHPGPAFPPSTHPNPVFPPSTHPNPVFPPSTNPGPVFPPSTHPGPVFTTSTPEERPPYTQVSQSGGMQASNPTTSTNTLMDTNGNFSFLGELQQN